MRRTVLVTGMILAVGCVDVANPSRDGTISSTSFSPVATTSSIPDRVVDRASGPDQDGGYQTIQSALNAARQCWAEKGPMDYHLAVEIDSFGQTPPFLSRVVNGNAIDAYPRASGELTAESLFDLVADTIAGDPDHVGVQFDTDTCHITDLRIDQDAETDDDELAYRAHLGAEPSPFPATETAPPPVVHLIGDNEITLLHPYDYCWARVCADSFGANQPDRAAVDPTRVKLLWRGDGVLSAFVDTDGCTTRIPLDGDIQGVWFLDAPSQPGPQLIHLKGATPLGDTSYLLELTSNNPGPPATPVVTMGWPMTSDPLAVSIEVTGYPDAPGKAKLTLESSRGTLTNSTVELVTVSEQPCGVLFGELDIDDPDRLGPPPLTAHLRLGEYTMRFMWPDEFDDEIDDSLLVKAMAYNPAP